MSAFEVVVAVVIVIGIAGVVVPLLPGTLLVGGAIVLWAVVEGTSTGWAVAGVAALVLALGAVVKYVVPGRRLQASGVPTSTLLLGGLLGLVGFFVIPVVGLVIGFVAGVYLAELRRVGREAAWPATVSALKAVGLSLLIEITACLLAAATWFAGLALT